MKTIIKTNEIYRAVVKLCNSIKRGPDIIVFCFFFQAEDGIRDLTVTGVQTCALPIYAERLIPQIGTEVAANALLKALEEPPADSVIIITAADPNALLPTILSRVVLVRVARIADSAVTAFVQQTLKIDSKAELDQRVTAAQGCIGKLFATDAARSGGVPLAARFVEAPLVFALGQVPFQARGGFTEMLDALADRLRDEAKRGGDSAKLVEAIARVMNARDVAQGNVNPQLLAAVLAEDLHGTQRS